MKDKNFFQINSAAEPCSGYEGKLQSKWNEIPIDTKFRTVCGKELIILSRGNWNFESGPDFINARISLDGKILSGDIEIHIRTSDWNLHGHHNNKSYNNVILHVVEKNDTENFHIPVLCIPNDSKISSVPVYLKDSKGSCISYFRNLQEDQLLGFFQDAGLDRLEKKSKQTLALMIKHGSRHAFFLKLFDALGFKKNRESFADLFRETLEKYPQEQFDTAFEEIIWGESGLLPAESSSCPDIEAKTEQQRLWNKWWKLRKDAGRKIIWNRSFLRPANTPERRIAALCEFIRKNGTDPLPRWIKLLEQSDHPETAAESLCAAFRCSGGFWADRITFSAKPLKRKSALTGNAKALELVVDVALPCLAALAELEGNSRVSGRLRILMKILPAPETNSVIRKTATKWFDSPETVLKLFSDAASRQGMHHIDAEYCSPVSGDCSICLIKNSFHPLDGK